MQFCYTTSVFMKTEVINRSDVPVKLMQAWCDLRFKDYYKWQTSDVTGDLPATKDGYPMTEDLKYLKRLNHTGRSVNSRRPYLLFVNDRSFETYRDIVRYFCPYVKLIRPGHSEDYPGIYWAKSADGWVAFETKWYGIDCQQGASWRAGR